MCDPLLKTRKKDVKVLVYIKETTKGKGLERDGALEAEQNKVRPGHGLSIVHISDIPAGFPLWVDAEGHFHLSFRQGRT